MHNTLDKIMHASDIPVIVKLSADLQLALDQTIQTTIKIDDNPAIVCLDSLAHEIATL